MTQTVTQNSSLSQNWVECIGCTPKEPRPGALCSCTTPRLCAQRRVVAYRASCCGCVSGRVACARCCIATFLPLPLGHDIKNCIATQSLLRTLRVVLRTLPRVSQHSCAVFVSQPMARCVETPGLPLLSRYNRLYRDTP